MKSLRLPIVRLALGLVIASASFIARPAFAAAKGEEHEHTELELQMEEINDAWRKVRRQVADAASNAETAALVAKIKKAATAALDLTPARAQDVAEEQRAAFVASYHEAMEKFVGLLGKLELALSGNRNADAEKLVEEIRAHQRSSHRDYKRPDEK